MKIFICPLDWGLGHATRCIPLVRALHGMGHQIILGAAGGCRALFQSELPHLTCIEMPGYNIRYPRGEAFISCMLFQTPKILLAILKEHSHFKRLAGEHHFDLVISDNRYGLFGGGCRSIILTHQLFIRLPESWRLRFPALCRAAEKLVRKILWQFLMRYDGVWVPDYPGSVNLSGELSHGGITPFPVNFILPLSRFPYNGPVGTGRGSGRPIRYLALLSGPEPQRTLFEEKVLQQFLKLKGARMVLLGKPQSRTTDAGITGVATAAHLEGPRFQAVLREAEIVVCRPGYTTLMELAAMQKRKVLLVPTPGQTEQEYLAMRLSRLGIAPFQKQAALDITGAEAGFDRYRGFQQFTPATVKLSSLLSPLLAGLQRQPVETGSTVT